MAKRNVQKDKQRSTKHTYKTKDRVTRTPLKTREKTCIKMSARRSLLMVLIVCNNVEKFGNENSIFTKYCTCGCFCTRGVQD